jgi:hypothetical protein
MIIQLLFFKTYIKLYFLLKVDESIVNVPLVNLQSKNTKNTNNGKSEVRFKQLIRDL